MAFTKVVGAGIHTQSNIVSHNINSTGIITATKFVGPITGGGGDFNAGIVTCTELDVNGNGDISGNLVVGGNLTANGDFTTLNTTLREVELLRVDAQNDNVAAGIITQRGTGNILDLYDTGSAVFSVRDGGNIIMGTGAGSVAPHAPLHIRTGTTGAITTLLKLHGPFTSNTGSDGTAIDFGTASDTSTGARIIGTREAAGAKGALRFCTGRENDAGFNGGRMVIDETGSVGIGSTIPLSAMALDIVGSIRYSEQSRGATGSNATPSYAFYGDHDTGMYRGNGVNILSFATAGVERLKIDADGAINIGHNPGQSTGTNTQNAILTLKGYPGGNESSAAILALIRGYDTTSASTDHTLGRIVFGDKQAGEYAFIEGEVEANGGSVGDTPGRLVFSTAKDGTSAPTEKLRITHDGKILIAQTTSNWGTSSNNSVIQLKNGVVWDYAGVQFDVGHNYYYNNGGDYKYIRGGYAARQTFHNNDGSIAFWSGGTGSADATFTWSEILRITSGGNLTVTGSTANLFTSNSYNILELRADENNDGGNDDCIFKFTHDGTFRSEMRYDESSSTLEISTADNRDDFSMDTDGKVTFAKDIATAQDYPNFRPTLDLNFAAEKKLDPRITYQRTGPASFVNEFGKVVLVGDNTPRFDHDPVTRESKGLLIEESRTNIFASSDPANSAWLLDGGATKGVNTTETTAPDGTFTACKLMSAASANSYSQIYDGLSRSSGGVQSLWAKKGTHNVIGIFDYSGGSGVRGWFDVNTGEHRCEGGSKVAAGVQSNGNDTNNTNMVEYPNGWYRCIYYEAANMSYAHFRIVDFDSDNEASASSNSIYLWGLQAEDNDVKFATSFIPCDTGLMPGTITRGADLVEITEEEFSEFYNRTEGSIVSEIMLPSSWPMSGYGSYMMTLSDGSYNNRVTLASSTGSAQFNADINIGSSNPTRTNLGSYTSGSHSIKAAMAYKISDSAGSLNGAAAVTSSPSGTLPLLTRADIGKDHANYNLLNGHMKRLMYYSKRLPNNQLVTLTS